MMNIFFTTNKLLVDALFYLSSISNATYCEKNPILLNASIGQHTRHYIELYQCLLWRKEERVVNYEQRPRDKDLETNVLVAQQAIKNIQNKLLEVDTSMKIFLQSSISDSEKIASSIERELIYNYEHCLHHLAIIRIGLSVIQPDLALPNHFGVAATTLEYLQTNQIIK